MQQVPVADPASHALHQFVVRNRVEVTAQVRVNDLREATVQPALDRRDRPVGVVAGPVGMLLRLQVLVMGRIAPVLDRGVERIAPSPTSDWGDSLQLETAGSPPRWLHGELKNT
jgi:hypothetical protein